MDKTAALPATSLYYTEGGSDKEYHAEIVAGDSDGFCVNFRYGRRGSVLKAGTKTSVPVPLAAAQKIFDKLIQEKQGKGYTEAQTGQAYALTAMAGQLSGHVPQLLNAVAYDALEALIADPAYGFQSKEDGQRIMIERNGAAGVSASNRRSLICPIPQVVADALLQVPVQRIVLDGELIGERFYIFDILQLDDADLREQPYHARHQHYQALTLQGSLVKLPLATDPDAKRALLQQISATNGEGIVIKRLAAPYKPGRPASGGAQLKYKFTESITCIVIKVNGAKRSINVGLLDQDGKIIDVGNVSVPVNQNIPVMDSLVEVRYMHMFQGGSLYQPFLLGIRTDIARDECRLTQVTRIKLKMPEDDDAE
jgi:bifunctional non-homologous end joining protein LigD